MIRHNPKTGERSLDVLRWGLIPNFEKDLAHARMLNNARAETVAKLPSFGVRPFGWTKSGRCFDRLLGVLILELHGAEIAQR